MIRLCLLLPADSADSIRAARRGWGFLTLVRDRPSRLVGVTAVSAGDGYLEASAECAYGPALLGRRPLPDPGVWVRLAGDRVAQHEQLAYRSAPVPVREFRSLVSGSEAEFLVDRAAFLLIQAGPDPRDWIGWRRRDGWVVPLPVVVLPGPDTDPRQSLSRTWPLRPLRESSVALIGVGSIGSAAAHALAMYGVGNLTLVDPDRLLGHNLVRHQSGRLDVGRHKVDAVKEALISRWPGTRVDALRRSVIDDADLVRPVLDRSSIVLCAADGVAPRRVTTHLARRSGLTAVLACVLDDGAIGEVLRFRPWASHGCLLCQRQHLIAGGAVDPEPALDADYGEGTRHRPMTAVGSDLQLVGQLAAKVAIATLLEEQGYREQRLAGEYAVIGLRPAGDAPPPFDVGLAEISWSPAVPPLPDCPTCSPP